MLSDGLITNGPGRYPKARMFSYGMLCPILLLSCLFLTGIVQAQLKIAKLKYNGGGDWYANKTALPNLIKFCNKELGMNLEPEDDIVEVGSRDLFLYPYLYM